MGFCNVPDLAFAILAHFSSWMKNWAYSTSMLLAQPLKVNKTWNLCALLFPETGIYYLICESLVLDKRRRRAEMVASTIAMLVSHDTTTKGGGLPWFTFSIYALPLEIWSQTWGAFMHWERNKYDCFNNLIEMIVEVCEIAQFTRATPGSSLVFYKPSAFLLS